MKRNWTTEELVEHWTLLPERGAEERTYTIAFFGRRFPLLTCTARCPTLAEEEVHGGCLGSRP